MGHAVPIKNGLQSMAFIYSPRFGLEDRYLQKRVASVLLSKKKMYMLIFVILRNIWV